MELLQLPPELLLRIIEDIDTISSLRDFALTSHAVRQTISNHEQTLCRRVLRNQIPQLISKEVIVAWEARQYMSTVPQLVSREKRIVAPQHFLARREAMNEEQFMADMTLMKAVGIGRLYESVSYFAGDFAHISLQKSHERYRPDESQEVEVSKAELLRIQRAFIRFELFTCLFARPYLPNHSWEWVNARRHAFWERYAPWEIEQIACVYDYFYRRLSHILDALSQQYHSGWAIYLSVLGGINQNAIQLQLARGLRDIQKLFVIARSPEACRGYLEARPPDPGIHSGYLTEGLLGARDHRTDDALKNLDPEDQARIIKPARVDDGDNGPESAWRWAHQEEAPDYAPDGGWVFSEGQMSLREHGYVFWDRSRIDRWGVLDTPWQKELYTAHQRLRIERESGTRIQALAESLADQGDPIRNG